MLRRASGMTVNRERPAGPNSDASHLPPERAVVYD